MAIASGADSSTLRNFSSLCRSRASAAASSMSRPTSTTSATTLGREARLPACRAADRVEDLLRRVALDDIADRPGCGASGARSSRSLYADSATARVSGDTVADLTHRPGGAPPAGIRTSRSATSGLSQDLRLLNRLLSVHRRAGQLEDGLGLDEIAQRGVQGMLVLCDEDPDGGGWPPRSRRCNVAHESPLVRRVPSRDHRSARRGEHPGSRRPLGCRPP